MKTSSYLNILGRLKSEIQDLHHQALEIIIFLLKDCAYFMEKKKVMVDGKEVEFCVIEGDVVFDEREGKFYRISKIPDSEGYDDALQLIENNDLRTMMQETWFWDRIEKIFKKTSL